ncbi:hypothetical protein L1887_55351 [Cichorium endivia]|nr:hypothetical protein L1887_55351 [Cichorium endivia]
MRIRVDKPSSEAISGRALYTHVPTGFEEDPLLHPDDQDVQPGSSRSPSSSSSRPYTNGNAKPGHPNRRSTRDSISTTFARRGGAPPYSRPTLYSRARLVVTQTTANVLSSFFLVLVVVWALSVRLLAAVPKFFAPSVAEQKQWDDPKRWRKEKLVKDVRYYAAQCGFEIRNETVETQDGYFLRMNRIIDPQTTHLKHSDGRGGFPVLIMHGLFQSSGSFVTSEERSLAFWLARHGGYQETGYDRIAYIGHSQGNGTMFISLSKGMVPELGAKLSYFGALAPCGVCGAADVVLSVYDAGTVGVGQVEEVLWSAGFHPAHEDLVRLDTGVSVCAAGLPDVRLSLCMDRCQLAAKAQGQDVPLHAPARVVGIDLLVGWKGWLRHARMRARPATRTVSSGASHDILEDIEKTRPRYPEELEQDALVDV